MKSKKEILFGNAIVGQSGGPTAAINATLSGVIKGALACPAIRKIYGAFNGIEGMLDGRFCELNEIFEKGDGLSLLENTPSAALGSCRKKLPALSDDKENIYGSLLEFFRQHDIRYFFYIGGNDSMDTVHKLSEYVNGSGYEMRVMGVPKTIDCDLAGTDHTPGYGSAAKYIATTVQEILRDTAVYTVKAVTIIEIMGRDAGWLTAAAGLPALSCGVSPDLIYLPEAVFDYGKFTEDVEKALMKHPNVVVAVSEGIRTADGRYVGEGAQSGSTDVFGHKYLAGTGKALEMFVKERFGCKVRSIELNLPQRCASHIASETDIKESVRVGKAAVRMAFTGHTGEMAGFKRVSTKPYITRTAPFDISKVANAIRTVPEEFINKRGNGVTDKCLEYINPLIQGQVKIKYKNGLPVHFVIKR